MEMLLLMAERKGEQAKIIKTRFEEYLCNIKKIVRKKEQLTAIVSKLSCPSGAKLSEIPKSKKPFAAANKTLFLIQEKMELETQIKKLTSKTERERNKLNKFITQLEAPEATKNITRELDILSIEASILRMRYFCAMEWKEINKIFYGESPDFDKKIDDYMKKLFRYHGYAFIDLSKIEVNNGYKTNN